MLQIYKGHADLSRRLVSYHLNGLSFREYLEFDAGYKFPVVSLDDIVTKHRQIAQPISGEIKPLVEFQKYLTHGYYPFYKESRQDYFQKIGNIINLVVETDLPSVVRLDYSSILKIKKLLAVISASVPFTPNIQKLSELLGTNRNMVLQFLDYLNSAQIIGLLHADKSR